MRTKLIHFLRIQPIQFIFCFIVPSVIVILFFYQYVFTGNNIRGGDFDYIAQAYEAFRITVLHFGQFPDWNPWIAGGVPLYANPQFGLISIQSLLVLPFGAIYGLKLAYVFYGLCGFWGMYVFGRNVVKADKIRALLISFIWIGSGFFYGHNISHFTFALFFLFPWLLVCLHYRLRKWAWVYMGGLVGIIALSSIHYALLMMCLACSIYYSVMVIGTYLSKQSFKDLKKEILFVTGSLGVFLLIAGHKLAATYFYANNNQRLIDSPEKYASIGTLVKSIFLPISTILPVPLNLQWGWAEYDMYIGIGTGIALLFAIAGYLWWIYKSYKTHSFNKKIFLYAPIMFLGILCFLIALGNFGRFSPYNILHHLPGFTQTRVPSRWMVFVMFTILTFIMASKKPKYIINIFLALGAIELFVYFGPIKNAGQDMFKPETTTFSQSFTQYDNGKKHLDASLNQQHSYYITTAENKGQVFADDSLVDTLDGVYNTSRCGVNTNLDCSLVMTNNATVEYWTPNAIKLLRTGPGNIELNINPYYAWSVNGQYPFASMKRLDPEKKFIITSDSSEINLNYNPKYSLRNTLKKLGY